MKKIFLALLLIFSAGIAGANEMAATSVSTPAAMTAPMAAMCTLSPASSSEVKGWVKFTQMKGYIQIEGDITGLKPGKHGFHVHEKGDCSAPDATSAGGHFNPTKEAHGAPSSSVRHVGDLGNITANGKGEAKFKFKDKVIQLSGEDSIVDKSLILHANLDDEKTQPTGNAGARVACGVIELMK